MCNQHVRVHVYIYKKKAFVYMIAYKTTSLEAVQSTYIQRRISAFDSSISCSDRFHCIANSYVKATLTAFHSDATAKKEKRRRDKVTIYRPEQVSE